MSQLSFFHILDASEPPVDQVELWTVEEIFQKLSSDNISRFEEDFRVDRKSAKKNKSHLAADLCAFANAVPYGGVLLIGIEDDGRITGFTEVGFGRAAEFEGHYENCPDVRFDHRRIAVTNENGKEDYIVALHVLPRRDRLVQLTSGDAYIRHGKTKRRLSEFEKRDIRIARGEIDYEREDVSLKYPENFRPDLVQQYCDNYRSFRKLSGSLRNEEILEWTKLGRLDGGKFIPNLACAMIFAKEPREVCSGAYIRFQRFNGRQEGVGSNYALDKDEWIEGPLPELIAKVDRSISAQMRNFTRLDKDGRFHTRTEYPYEAWIEAVVNACVHRSYHYRNMPIYIKMFDDRISVESPGGFHPPTTAETVYGSHNPRNPHLMEALFYFGYVKCAHEGTERMRSIMASENLPPPVFSETDGQTHQVHVALKNKVDARKTFVDEGAIEVLGKTILEGLETSERLIVNYLAEHGKINVTQAHSLLQCSWRKARSVLNGLVDKGLCERVIRNERDAQAFYRLEKASDRK